MRAAVFYENGGPDVLRYEEIADPVLWPGGVLVDVQAVSIQGGDLLHRASTPAPHVPHVVGYQAAGVVREVGSNVTSVQPGDRVVCTMGAGSHAERAVASGNNTYLVPDGLAIEVAAGVPIEFGTAADCLFEFGHLVAGETVLVQAGAGGVGLAAIQLAKAAGATVLATASSPERLSRLTPFGMDHGIDYVHDDVAEQVKALTDGRGVDLVVDPVGGRTLEASIAAHARAVVRPRHHKVQVRLAVGDRGN
jgi:NADPH2:quinone reductase